MGGTLLTKEEDILDGFISLFADDPKEESSNPDSETLNGITEEALNGGIESSIQIRISKRNRQRKEHANSKRAKKYTSPSEELTRLQIREDIRKMRDPLPHIKEILKLIGFDEFLNHEKYLPDSNLMHRPKYSVYRDDDTGIDDDVQFIGINTKEKRKRKRKRKHRHHGDYHLSRTDDVSPSPNSVFSVLSNEQNGDAQNVINIDFDDGAEPQRKRTKQSEGADEILKCPKCHKIFTLEVDLLIHKYVAPDCMSFERI